MCKGKLMKKKSKYLINAKCFAIAITACVIGMTGCAGNDSSAKTSDTSDNSRYGYSEEMISQNINPEVYKDTLWRIDNEAPDDDMPRNFRTCYSEPLVENAKENMDTSIVPSTDGLADTKMSGSAEFDESQLVNMIAEIRKVYSGDICIVDLRQESHVLVNGMSVSRYGLKDWGNIGKDLDQVNLLEDELLKTLKGQTIDAYALDDDKQPENQQLITVENVKSEKEIAEENGVEYYRLPCTDHVCPTNEEIDEFINYVKNLDKDTWLHFHCEAGKGRTTFFMVCYDMMLNPDVPLTDIVYRQCEIGGNFVLKDSSDDWKDPYYAEKAKNVELFYQYVQENYETDYETSFSEWMLNQ